MRLVVQEADRTVAHQCVGAARVIGEDFLLGRNFFYSTVELQLPLNRIIRVVFLPNIEGIAAVESANNAVIGSDTIPVAGAPGTMLTKPT